MVASLMSEQDEGSTPQRPDHATLFLIASAQHGHFTADQAAACGISPPLLQHHLRTGRYRRVAWGLYRFRDYPESAEDDLCAAWLAAGRDHAVVSHASALALLDLSDVIPDGYHLTVPRARRNVRVFPGTLLHTTTRPFAPTDLTERAGMVVTAPARTILDAAAYGIGPEQIVLAIGQAVQRAQIDLAALNVAAKGYSRRVATLIRDATALADARGGEADS
jgi:predicted transcriptional regulator of viral defense system